MKIKTIEIKRSAVVAEFLSNLKRVGSHDWSIYANQDGEVDTFNNADPLSGWTFVTGFCGAWDNLQNDEEEAKWLMSKEGFDWAQISQAMEEDLEINSVMCEADEDGGYEFQKFEVNFT